MIYLVRQGETDWNLYKKFNGCTDNHCSFRKRARQTCETIYKGLIIFDDRLTEIDCGEFEGTEETPDSLKLFWQAIRTGDKGTERFIEFAKRNCDFCDMIMKDYIGNNVLIVTHSANARIINYFSAANPRITILVKGLLKTEDC
nr:histidine phosphatase family protein [uncultured Clostridium sp.]